MTTAQYLDRWRSSGAITPEQADVLSALARKERFSVFLELNALLSLGLSTLAAWFGVRFSYLGFFIAGSMREVALAYGAVAAGAGVWTHRLEIKRHFLDSYLQVAANAMLIALTSGAMDREATGLW